MSVRKDDVQINVTVLGNQAQAELAKMEKEISDLEKSLKSMKKGTEEYNKTAAQIEQAKTAMGAYRKEMDLNKMSSQQLIKYQKELQREAKAAWGTDNFKKIKPELDAVNAKVKEMNVEIRGVSQSSGSMVNSMMQMTPFAGQFNTLKGSMQNVTTGTKAATGGFKSLRTAIIGTGIGALILALTSLFAWFGRTEKGANTLKVITAALGQVFNTIMDVASKMGEYMVNAFTKPKEAIKGIGDFIKELVLGRVELLMKGIKGIGEAFSHLADFEFKKAAKSAGEAFVDINRGINPLAWAIEGTVNGAKALGNAIGDIYDEVKKDAQAAINLQHRENQLRIDRRKWMVEEAELLEKISELKKAGVDQTLNAAEREKALSEAIKLQNQVTGERVRLASEEYLIQKERNSLSDSTSEDLDKEAQLLTEVNNIRRDGNNQMKEIFGQQTGLQKQMAAQQEELRNKEIAADKALRSLKIEAMDEGLEKEIEKINLEYEEKMAAIDGNEEQVREQLAILEAQKVHEIAEARRLEEEGIRIEDEEIQKALLEQKFLAAMMSEQEYQDALYEQQRENMQRSLDLIKEQHGEESLAYLKKYNELLKLDKDHNDKKADNAKRTAEIKESLESATYEASKNVIEAGIELLGRDEEARKNNAGVIKAFSSAKILVDYVEELQAIWKAANQNPANALFPGASTLIAFGKTAAATARKTIALANINSAQFKAGGIFSGARHSQGGNPVLDGRTGEKIAEMEAGEPYMILSRNTYANNRSIVDQLLYTSQFRNGAPIFETGGIANPYRSTSVTAPATSGSPDRGQSPGSDQAVNQVANMNAELLIRIGNEIVALRRDMLSGAINAKLVYSQFENMQNEITTVRSDAAIK